MVIDLPSRWMLACLALIGAAALNTHAFAQVSPGQQVVAPPANPVCQRLEGQLASVDRGGGDPARAEQTRRYEDAAAKQQAELDRATIQAKRSGCDNSGFFSLFSGQSPQCIPVNNQIQQMRANLEQISVSLERLRGGGGAAEREGQRRSVLLALAQNNCGPQYAAAARNAQQQQGGFLENLFGNSTPSAPSGDFGAPSSTFRTVCVRTCDGYYFPISFATVQSRFGDDEKTCKSLCPASDAALYTFRNPGEDINQAVSIGGQPYTSSPNAFSYRKEFNPSCACKAAGQTWSDALRNIDDRASVGQGDIIVTEENAKKLSQPPVAPAAKASAAKKGPPSAANAPAANAQVAPAEAPSATAPAGSSDNKPIRSVGPTFIPGR